MKKSKIYILIFIALPILLSTNIFADSKTYNEKQKNSKIYEMPIVFNFHQIPVITIHKKIKDFLFIAIYPDGKIIWSDDYNNLKISDRDIFVNYNINKPIYNYTQISPNKITELINLLESMEIFKDPGKNFSPNEMESMFLTINTPQMKLQMISYHEKAEIIKNTFYDAYGNYINTEKETSETLLKKQPSEYRRFRENWDFIKNEIFALVPKDTKLIKKIEGISYNFFNVDPVKQKILLSQKDKFCPAKPSKELLRSWIDEMKKNNTFPNSGDELIKIIEDKWQEEQNKEMNRLIQEFKDYIEFVN